MLALLLAFAALDTLRLLPVATAPRFDGAASVAEYGAPSLLLEGGTTIWLRRDSGFVYLAATMTDSSADWADDLVISLGVHGDAGAAPGHFDFQWCFRRVLDSSIVYRGEGGHWRTPQDDPDWRLGAAREGGGWEVRAATTAGGWSLEVRFDPAYFSPPAGRRTRLALRRFDDGSRTWSAWPHPASVRQATEVERHPALWAELTP